MMKNPKDFQSIRGDLPWAFHEALDGLSLDDIREMSREDIVKEQVAWRFGTSGHYDTIKHWLDKAGLQITEKSEQDEQG